MSTVKKIVNILLSLVLAVLLTVLAYAVSLQFTLFNDSFMLDLQLHNREKGRDNKQFDRPRLCKRT